MSNNNRPKKIMPLNILRQSIEKNYEQSIFKIELDGKIGTGFFCNILSKNIKVLLTNNHVLNQNFLDQEKIINISFDLKGKYVRREIIIEGNRLKYTDEDIDFTIIEILKEDQINDFLEVDENIDDYINKQILTYQFDIEPKIKVSFGEIKSKNSIQILYENETNPGSSGSPIILAENSKLIALHKGKYSINKNLRIGIGIPITLIINIINSISCKYFIESKNVNIEIQIVSDRYFNQNKDKKMLIEGEIQPIKPKFKFGAEGVISIYFLQDNMDNIILNMEKMFLNCKCLSEVYFLNYKRNKMSGLSKLFNGCTSLKKVNLFSFDAFNENDMSGMFDGCSSLRDIHYISFNAFNAVNLSNMFKGCSSLKKIDLKPLLTNYVQNMSNMFEGCSSLEEIDLSSIKINTINDIDMSNMFKNCESLKAITLFFNNSEIKINMDRMFFKCCSLENIFFLPKKKENEEKVVNKSNKINVISMSEIFYNCSKLKEIDLSAFKTECVENMTSVFEGCSLLKEIDLSTFNANKVIYMNNLFFECSLLEKIKLFDLINKNNATYMKNMFFNCSNLKDIIIPDNFHTKNVVDMSGMFAGCNSLKVLNIPNELNTSNVRTMKKMFYECSSLNKINLSSFNTENLEDCAFMFYGCKTIMDINLSCFNTKKVINMSNMFSECTSLQTLNLSSFKSDNLQNISNMFKGCISLKTINLSSFKIKATQHCCCSVQDINMQNIFDNVPSSCKLISESEILKDKFSKCFIF